MIRRIQFLFRKIRLFRRSKVVRKDRVFPEWIGRFRCVMYLFSGIGLAFIVLQSGLHWELPPVLLVIERVVDYLIYVTFLSNISLNVYYTIPRSRYLRENYLDLIVLIPILFTPFTLKVGVGAIIVRHTLSLIRIFTRTQKFVHVIHNVRLNTAQIVVASFMATILLGAILLTFPAATTDGLGASLADALFTSASATCVTGLIVQDTPNYFTPFGQIVILTLIQLGGLGIMTYSAFVALLIGRFSLGQRKMVQEMLEEERNVFSMIFYIFKMTFLVEGIGIVLLFSRWFFVFENPGRALYFSVFHAVSAFCNAGFSLFPDSLERAAGDPLILFPILGLIIAGGFGFIANFELTELIRRKRKKLSLHTRLVLGTSATLILSGFLAVFFFEFDGVFLHVPLPGKLMAALFQSATTRTAGFNTVPIGSLAPVTLTIMLVLMFIGASPGSTGGGIKTTTFAVLLLAVRSVFRGSAEVEAARETIPRGVVRKALAILVISLTLVMTIFILLLIIEQKPYLDTLFETVSAFGTVGLSTGITPQLSDTGKTLIVILMFLGRIGPLTMGLALARTMRKQVVGYPQARVLIG